MNDDKPCHSFQAWSLRTDYKGKCVNINEHISFSVACFMHQICKRGG